MEILVLSAMYGASLLILMTKFIVIGEEIKQANSTNKVNHFKRLFDNALKSDYDAQESPSHVSVMAAVALLNIPSVKFSRSEIETEFLFITAWKDNRLSFGRSAKELGRKHGLIAVPSSVRDRLWIPWILMPECKKCKSGWATGEQPRQLHFSPNSEAFIITFRESWLFSCQFDLTYYPFDAHQCRISLELADITFTNNSMELTDAYKLLFRRPMETAISPGLPSEFYFDKLFVKQSCHQRMTGLLTPDQQCLQYGFRFHRIAAYYVMLIYTPSFTIVVVSWISFWLDEEVPAPRVTLGLMCLLTLTTQFSNAQKDLPPVAYIKALDVWMIMCVVMVFGSLLEFTLAHIKTYSQKNTKPALRVKEALQSATTFVTKEETIPKMIQISKKVNWMDAKARVIFPVIFTVFNFIYWPYFTRNTI